MPQSLSLAKSKHVRKLHRKKYRTEFGEYLVEGERILTELVAQSGTVQFLFGVPERYRWLTGHFPTCDVYEISNNDADLFATESPQGIGAVVSMPEAISFRQLGERSGPILVLDGLTDPGNVGTIMRTAEWFGVAGIVAGDGTVDPWNPKVVRSSMGAIFNLPVLEKVSPSDLAASGRPLFALDMQGEVILGGKDGQLPSNGIYIIGSEAHGVSSELLSIATTVSIRGKGAVESLNAATATAILCYELTRQS